MKMIVECLSGNMALLDQPCYRDLINILFLKNPAESIRDLRLHVFSHFACSVPNVAIMTALIVCILFSASSNTFDCSDSNTSSVTSMS